MARIHVRVSPGAARSTIVGRHGNGWKARIAAAPEGGRANAELVRLLAEVLDLPKGSVSIAVGHAARDKTVAIEGIALLEAERRLDAAVTGG